MNKKQTLINVIGALNTINVSGKHNLQQLLASISALEQVVQQMTLEEQEQAKPAEDEPEEENA